MNFIGLLWVIYIGSVSNPFSPPTFLKLPAQWSGSFLARAAATVKLTTDRSSLPESATTSTASSPRKSWLALSLPFQWQSLIELRGSTSLITSTRSPSQSKVSRPLPLKVLRFAQDLTPWSRRFSTRLWSTVPVTVTSAPRSSESTGASSQSLNLQHCGQRVSLPRNREQNRPSMFQLRVNGYLVAEFPQQAEADLVAQRLRQLFQDQGFAPDRLRLTLKDGLPAGGAGSSFLFVVNQDLATALNRNSELIAIDWINHLRTALDAPPLSLVEAQAQMYSLVDSTGALEGTASWYGAYFHGRLTAAGEIFNQHELTAAHPSLPFNTFLKITNLENGKTVIVRINDRGPYVGTRSLDLSLEAAQCLESKTSGVVSYRAVIMKHVDRPEVPPLPANPPGNQTIARRL